MHQKLLTFDDLPAMVYCFYSRLGAGRAISGYR